MFAFDWDASPYGAQPISDSQVYDVWAQAITKGQFLRTPAFYYSPLYPYVLSLLYLFFGRDFLVVSIFQAVVSSFTAVILASLSMDLFGLVAGVVTGLLAAVYIPFVFYSAPVTKESLELLLLALFLSFSMRALKHRRYRDFAAAGVSLGLCALTRGNILILAPIILLAGLINRPQKKRLRGWSGEGVFIMMTVVCILPATIHNFVVSGEFIPITYNDGYNLFIGNSEDAHAVHVAYQVTSTPGNEEETTTLVASRALGHQARPSEVSRYWRDRAFDFIFAHPERDADLFVRKLAAFLNAREISDFYDMQFFRQTFDSVITLPLAEFWVIFLLASLGIVVTWPTNRRASCLLGGCALGYTFSVLVFYVTDRYRLPAVIFLLPLAGAAIPFSWNLLTAKRFLPVGLGLGVACAAALIMFRPFPDKADPTGYNLGTLSELYRNKGEERKAHDFLEKAVAFSPKSLDPGAYIIDAFIENKRGNVEEATYLLKTGLNAYPEDDALQYNFAEFLTQAGDTEGGLVAMRKAVELDPKNARNYAGLASLYEQRKEFGQALSVVEKGLQVDPTDASLSHLRARINHIE